MIFPVRDCEHFIRGEGRDQRFSIPTVADGEMKLAPAIGRS